MNVYFLVIPYQSAYNFILQRSFLTKLYVVTSTIHLKIKYHNNSGELFIIPANLHGARMIKETILKNPCVNALTFEKKRKKTSTHAIVVVGLGV